MGKLPKNWVEPELKEITSFVIGGDWGKDPGYEDPEYIETLCIRGSEIKNWNKNKGNTASIRKLKAASLKSRELQLGDILLEISGGGPDQPVGRTVLIDKAALEFSPQTPKICTNFLRLVRIYKNVDSNYVNHYLHFFYNSGEITKYQGGSNNLRNLKFKEYETIKIPLPPLKEQQRIVQKLDSLFKQLETIKASMAKIPVLLKDFRQQVLTQAVTGKLVGSKKFKTLSDFDIKIKTGPFGSALHKSEYIEGGIFVINPSHILRGEIVPDNRITISVEKMKELNRWKLVNGDVLLGRRGEMGRAAKYSNGQGIMICGTGSIVLKVPPSISADFLTYFLRSPFCVEYLERNSVGSTMINLNQNIIKSLPFPSLTFEQQNTSVAKIKLLFSTADAIEQQYQILKQKIDNLPQAILHKAFKGELVEQLESDGDARELLKEIEKLKIR